MTLIAVDPSAQLEFITHFSARSLI